MNFCPKCGSILMPKKVNEKRVMQCSCGHIEAPSGTVLGEKMNQIPKKDIEVVDKEINVFPIVDEKCPKCKNDKAYFFTKQTRASDEPETKFYKCVKCAHQWRDYK